MSITASIDIKLSCKEQKIMTSQEILKRFINNGWAVKNNDKILYLPLGDDDMFEWLDDLVNESELFEIIAKKEQANEIIGVGLTWRDTNIGGTILIYPNFDLTINLTINRRKLFNDITDVNWYLEKIISCFDNSAVDVESFSFSQG